MKPYLVDVPVRVQVWIRPDCQRKQFEVIKQARPSVLFLISDGGRNEAEWEAIRQNRHMLDTEIDWECTIYRLYEDHNNGMYAMMPKCRELVWSKVDRCIFLEDDILPSVSYFQYCAELLEKYKDDTRINLICGMNHLGVSQQVNTDYFFARQGSVWGTATWRRAHALYNDFSYGQDPYIMGLLKQRTRHNKTAWKRMQAYAVQERYEGHVAGGEFFVEFAMYGHNQLQIIPKVNMISNIGCSADSSHADALQVLPRGIRRVFNMELHEMAFPMKHPKFVIPDIDYEKKRNRIMGYNYPLVKLWRMGERLIRKLVKGDLKYIIKKLKDKYYGER